MLHVAQCQASGTSWLISLKCSCRFPCEAQSHSCFQMHCTQLHHCHLKIDAWYPNRYITRSVTKWPSDTDQLEFSTFSASTHHFKCMSGDTYSETNQRLASWLRPADSIDTSQPDSCWLTASQSLASQVPQQMRRYWQAQSLGGPHHGLLKQPNQKAQGLPFGSSWDCLSSSGSSSP